MHTIFAPKFILKVTSVNVPIDSPNRHIILFKAITILGKKMICFWEKTVFSPIYRQTRLLKLVPSAGFQNLHYPVFVVGSW